jgi:hypothetical protein
VQVTLEIHPEPTAAERGAIEVALRALEDDARPGRGAWWEAGLAENLDVSEDGGPEPAGT